MAINGDGFFSVQAPTSTVDNQPVFSGVTDYTRAGDFQVNANGYLVNGAGYYLMGTTVDPKTGNPTGSVPTVLNFSEQLRSGAGHHGDSICRKPSDRSGHPGEPHCRRRIDHRGRRP